MEQVKGIFEGKSGMSSTFVVAEAGVNHNGNLKTALDLVDAAKNSGADAVKFQLFDPTEQISINSPTATYQRQATGENSMLEMAKSYDLPWNAHIEIAEYCSEIGIMYMSSCFDVNAIDFYQQIGGKILKIASGEITNTDLLVHAAKTNLPIILSTGMSTLPEIGFATELILKNSSAQLTLLHCVSRYPTPIHTLNLNFINTLKSTFNLPIGLSDHSQHQSVGGWAVNHGAVVIEKHFTLDKASFGPDHAMSCSPNELKEYIKEIRDAEIALGTFDKVLTKEELEVRDIARRSIVASKNLAKGTIISPDHLALKRPGNGMDPSMKSSLVGKKLKRDLKVDDQISLSDL